MGKGREGDGQHGQTLAGFARCELRVVSVAHGDNQWRGRVARSKGCRARNASDSRITSVTLNAELRRKSKFRTETEITIII